jgi:endonuclease/exonuclease/phosphatase family metal-dependent hydrolase
MSALTVATFNIRNARACDGRNSWLLRRRVTVTAIDELRADVLGLQEVFPRPLSYLLRRLARYDSVGEGRSGGGRGERCAIMVWRDRLQVLRTQTQWFGDAPQGPSNRLPGASFPRVATSARLRDGETSAEFDVWNVHLDERIAGNRTSSTMQLATWMDPGVPTVVLGDFNAVPGDADVFAPLLAAGLRQVLVEEALGTAHDFTGRTDVPRLDHILVSDHWDVLEAGVVTVRPRGRLPSDHWPVRGVVRLR